MPVPVKAIVCGEFGALLVIATPPVELPATVGANFAVKERDCPGLTVLGTVIPLIEYPDPEADAELIESGPFPELDTVTTCEVLAPTETFPNVMEFGE